MTDSSGNTAAEVTRTVYVILDVVAPVITLLGSTPANIEVGSAYVDAGAFALDNIDGDLTGHRHLLDCIPAMRRFLISDANIGPKRCHQYWTALWLTSTPRSCNKSSTFRSESGNLT